MMSRWMEYIRTALSAPQPDSVLPFEATFVHKVATDALHVYETLVVAVQDDDDEEEEEEEEDEDE